MLRKICTKYKKYLRKKNSFFFKFHEQLRSLKHFVTALDQM